MIWCAEFPAPGPGAWILDLQEHGLTHDSSGQGCVSDMNEGVRKVGAAEEGQGLSDGRGGEVTSELGQRIRHIRKRKKSSLAEISEISGVSVAMLSHIERGKATPSLKVLERLRSALGVSMLDLFPPGEAEGNAPRCPVVRRDERISLNFDEIGLTKQRLSPDDSSDLEVLMLRIAPGGGSGPEPWTRPGEKGGLILSGRARLQIGDDVFDLAEGDSFQFDSSIPHKFECLGDAPAEILWIIKSNPLAKAVNA